MHQVVSIPPLIKFLSETRKHHTGDEDASAMRDLKGLAENDSRSVKRGQAGENGYGTWGYTGKELITTICVRVFGNKSSLSQCSAQFIRRGQMSSFLRLSQS